MSSPHSSKSAPAVFVTPQRMIAGEIDRMRPDFEALTRRNGDVIMDLGRTEAIDGSGVGAIVYVCKRLAARGHRLTVRNVSGQPDVLLGSAGLLRVLGTDVGSTVSGHTKWSWRRAQSA